MISIQGRPSLSHIKSVSPNLTKNLFPFISILDPVRKKATQVLEEKAPLRQVTVSPYPLYPISHRITNRLSPAEFWAACSLISNRAEGGQSMTQHRERLHNCS